MGEGVVCRQAAEADLPGIAEVFIAAFPESVQHYVGGPVSPEALTDVFAICLDAEADGLFVAEAEGRTAGYVFAPVELNNVFRVALLRGHVGKLFWGWITGRYRIGMRPVGVAARNMLGLVRDAGEPEAQCAARILSIAVHPDFQGRGIGGMLMSAGLEYLDAHETGCVRLEVRPGNEAARRLYEKNGFVTVGRTSDTQGEWLVMMRYG